MEALRFCRLFLIYSPGGTLEIKDHSLSSFMFNIFNIYWKHTSLIDLVCTDVQMFFFPWNVSIFRLPLKQVITKVWNFIRIKKIIIKISQFAVFILQVHTLLSIKIKPLCHNV